LNYCCCYLYFGLSNPLKVLWTWVVTITFMKQTCKIMIYFFRMNYVYDEQCTFGNSYYGFGEYINRPRHYSWIFLHMFFKINLDKNQRDYKWFKIYAWHVDHVTPIVELWNFFFEMLDIWNLVQRLLLSRTFNVQQTIMQKVQESAFSTFIIINLTQLT
jgi:hypothetical protein